MGAPLPYRNGHDDERRRQAGDENVSGKGEGNTAASVAIVTALDASHAPDMIRLYSEFPNR
jgi:hypothetical protein